MPARLRGINMTAVTRFETRYVTRANLAMWYAPRTAQFSARVESTSATDTSHFASSLAPTMRGEKKQREDERSERPVVSGNLGLHFRAFAWRTYPGVPSTSPMCLHVPSTHNCAHNLRARHMDC